LSCFHQIAYQIIPPNKSNNITSNSLIPAAPRNGGCFLLYFDKIMDDFRQIGIGLWVSINIIALVVVTEYLSVAMLVIDLFD
jgi:hypothetical protein